MYGGATSATSPTPILSHPTPLAISWLLIVPVPSSRVLPLLSHRKYATRSGFAVWKAGGRAREVGYARLDATVAAVRRGTALHIAIPERPGLGLTLDLEEIARHPNQQSAYLPLFRVGWERRAPNVAAETHWSK